MENNIIENDIIEFTNEKYGNIKIIIPIKLIDIIKENKITEVVKKKPVGRPTGSRNKLLITI